MTAPTVNDYLDQIRLRIGEREKAFADEIRALNSSQAAKGNLRSGATITLSLRTLRDSFDAQTNEILTYLGKTLSRTKFDRSELLGLTAQVLQQSKLTFFATLGADRLRAFAPSKGIDAVIDDALREVDQRLALRLREFALGLSDAEPTSLPIAPAGDRYVTIQHNELSNLTVQLAELSEIVRGDNEAGEEDREIALSEIAAFEQTIIQPRVSTDLIERFVRRVLNWLMKLFAGAAVAAVAEKLIEGLTPLLTIQG